MKLIAFAFVFALLLASISLAAGLQITEIDVNVDYDEAYTYRVEDRDRIDSTSVPATNNSKIDADVLPGSNLTFTVRVENTFTGEDPDLRGVFVTMTIEEIDDGGDLDEESIDFDLEPGDDNRVDVKFNIPLDVDSGTYNVVMGAEGEDRNETLYNTELNLKLEVKKQSHDIRITNVLLEPSVVECDRKAKLVAEITNAGSNPENEVALEFKATSLGINSYDKDISLLSSDEASEEEKTYTKTLNFEVPDFLKAGKFPILVNLYWKNFVLFDQKTMDFVVKDCVSGAAKAEPKQEDGKETVEVIQPEEKPEEQKEAQEQVTATEEVSVLKSPALLAILLGGFAVIIILVLVAFGYLKRAKPQ